MEYTKYTRIVGKVGECMKGKDLMQFKSWVVVGDVLNRSKYAYKILDRLKESGYNVVGVNPRDKSGELYKTLKEVPYDIEVIDLCINHVLGLEIMKEAAEIGIKNVLIQPGAESADILNFCREKGINAIEGCVLVELSRM
jgi:uncharacterized protein